MLDSTEYVFLVHLFSFNNLLVCLFKEANDWPLMKDEIL